MKNWIKKMAGLLLAAAVFLTAGAGTASALAANQVPALPPGTSDLTVSLQYTEDGGQRTAVSGAGLSLYRVADLAVENGTVRYVPAASFSDVNVDYTQMTASGSNEAAKRLADALDGKAADVSGVTDGTGEAHFSGLSAGVYLLVESARDGAAKKYELLSPSLLTVPELVEAGGSFRWNSQVQAEPKTSLVRMPGKTTPPPGTTTSTGKKSNPTPADTTTRSGSPVKTDDWSGLFLWSGMLIVAGAGLLLTVRSGWKRKRN